MHVYTLVIVPGGLATSHERAWHLVRSAGGDAIDWHLPGGRFEDRFRAAGLPTDERWPYAVLVEDIPLPMPAAMNPAAFVSPEGEWIWRPINNPTGRRWLRRMDDALRIYRPGYTAVIMDAHM